MASPILKVSLIFLGLLFGAHSIDAAEYTGRVVNIVDGDTFDIEASPENVRVRLCGVDSPERGEPDFHAAKEVLRKLIAGKTVRCLQVGDGTPCDGRSCPKNRDRIVAQCFLGNLDIAAEMVRADMACDWPWFSGGHYRLSPSTCIDHRQPKQRCRP
jgi:endonuclease YncB( thermonuclease family)